VAPGDAVADHAPAVAAVVPPESAADPNHRDASSRIDPSSPIAVEAADEPEPAPPRDTGAEARPSSVAGPAAPTPHAPDAHVRAMVAAIERLAQRAKAADEALAAVAAEVDAFSKAQQRFEAANTQREQRRRDLERFRDEVAHLAREILGRVDGLFDVMSGDPAREDPAEEPLAP
jgi:hypothetical protein